MKKSLNQKTADKVISEIELLRYIQYHIYHDCWVLTILPYPYCYFKNLFIGIVGMMKASWNIKKLTIILWILRRGYKRKYEVEVVK